MTPPLDLMLAWRYFRSKKRHPFIGVISNISVLGVAVGVGALITVLAVMSGFEEDLVNRVVGTYAHSVIEADQPFAPTDSLEEQIRSVTPLILATAPFVDGQALLQTPASSRGSIVRAARFEDESRVSRIAAYLQEGAYPAEGTTQILVGNVLARIMNLKIGSAVQFYSPARKKPSEFTVSGIFHSGMYDYDANLVYLSLGAGQTVFELGDRISGVAVKYRSPADALTFQRKLQAAVGYDRYVRSWRDMNATLFGALKLEKSVMFIILALIVLVACFNIIGTLTLLVMDRTKDIGILKAVGASEGHVVRIFGCVGFLIGASGTVLGLGIGAGLCYALKTFKIVPIPAEIYYFDRLPVNFRWDDAATVAGAALLISLLSALYPAIAAAKLKTSEALRYE
jgi:lipoprotein-releasing system permease protein